MSSCWLGDARWPAPACDRPQQRDRMPHAQPRSLPNNEGTGLSPSLARASPQSIAAHTRSRTHSGTPVEHQRVIGRLPRRTEQRTPALQSRSGEDRGRSAGSHARGRQRGAQVRCGSGPDVVAPGSGGRDACAMAPRHLGVAFGGQRHLCRGCCPCAARGGRGSGRRRPCADAGIAARRPGEAVPAAQGARRGRSAPGPRERAADWTVPLGDAGPGARAGSQRPATLGPLGPCRSRHPDVPRCGATVRPGRAALGPWRTRPRPPRRVA